MRVSSEEQLYVPIWAAVRYFSIRNDKSSSSWSKVTHVMCWEFKTSFSRRHFIRCCSRAPHMIGFTAADNQKATVANGTAAKPGFEIRSILTTIKLKEPIDDLAETALKAPRPFRCRFIPPSNEDAVFARVLQLDKDERPSS